MLTALNAGHAEAAVALWEQAELTRPWNDAHEDFARAVAGPASAVLGLLTEDELLGTAMVGHDGHRGWIYYLAVARAKRRRGLGRQLVLACEEWLRTSDVPKLNLMVRAGNDDVRAFYDALGYRTDEVAVLSKRLDGR
jgi:ribosomal protein S18 acetylase RimI-like enzyme